MQGAVTSICILSATSLVILCGVSGNQQNFQLERKVVGNREKLINFIDEPRLAYTNPCNVHIVAKIPVADEFNSGKSLDRAEEHNSNTEQVLSETEMQVSKMNELEQRLTEVEKLICRIDDLEKRLKETESEISNKQEPEQRLEGSRKQTSTLSYEGKRILNKITLSKTMYPKRQVRKPNWRTLQRRHEGVDRYFKNNVPNEGIYKSMPVNKTMLQMSNVKENAHGKMFQQTSRLGESLVNLNVAMTNFSKRRTPRKGLTKSENESFKMKVSSGHVIDQNGDKQGPERDNANKKSGIVQKEYHGMSNKKSRFSRMKRSDVQDKLNVAFSANMNGWVELNLADVETLPFTEVSLNHGNAYDAHLKTFTCPVTGIYFFTTTIVSLDHKFEAAIVLNGDNVALITTGDGSGYKQGSNSVTVHCNQGQMVWIRVFNKHGVGKTDSIFSIFTGFLVHSLAESSSN